MRQIWILVLFACLHVYWGCDDEHYETVEITSISFKDGEEMPSQHTCSGDGISPPLSFSLPPKGTKSLVVMMEDPDRLLGTYSHWLLWGLPPETTVPENIDENIPEKWVLGMADDGKTEGYLPPCPPPGEPHRYIFKVYALDTMIKLEAGSDREALGKKINDHILGYGELKGIVTPK